MSFNISLDPPKVTTFYVINGNIIPLLGVLEDADQARIRFRETWAASYDPTEELPLRHDGPLLQFIFSQWPGAIHHVSVIPVDEEGLGSHVHDETEARFYELRTHAGKDSALLYVEPQVSVYEKPAGEARVRLVESLSLREFANASISEYTSDLPKLYRIQDGETAHLIHADNLEGAANLVEYGTLSDTSPYAPDQAADILDQLQAAQRDHEIWLAPSNPPTP